MSLTIEEFQLDHVSDVDSTRAGYHNETAHVLAIPGCQPWMEEALCAEIDNDIFFPDKGGSTREAKKICAGCIVAAECLDYALANNERFGIWGGMSERERRPLTNFTEQEAS